jgi:hypothetical protein
MTTIKNPTDDLQGRHEDSTGPSAQTAEHRNERAGRVLGDADRGNREVTVFVTRHSPSESRAWQMARNIGGPMSVPNSIYETIVSPDGTVRRKVRRDVVRRAARLAPGKQTEVELKTD